MGLRGDDDLDLRYGAVGVRKPGSAHMLGFQLGPRPVVRGLLVGLGAEALLEEVLDHVEESPSRSLMRSWCGSWLSVTEART